MYYHLIIFDMSLGVNDAPTSTRFVFIITEEVKPLATILVAFKPVFAA